MFDDDDCNEKSNLLVKGCTEIISDYFSYDNGIKRQKQMELKEIIKYQDQKSLFDTFTKRQTEYIYGQLIHNWLLELIIIFCFQ